MRARPSEAKASKLRWRRIPNDVRATCFTGACTALTHSYCKRADCREPHCKRHKGDHILKAHTIAKLVKGAGEVRLKGFELLPDDRRIEILALLSKIRRLRSVEQSDIGRSAPDTFVAWALVGNTLIEQHSNRVEHALHNLYVELRTADQQRMLVRR